MHVEDQIAPRRPETRTFNVPARRQHNLQLLLANLNRGSQKLREGSAIAFASASNGNGAGHVARLFAVELARHTGRRTLVIDSQRLQSLRIEDYLEMPRNCHPTNIENLWMMPAREGQKTLSQRSFLMPVTREGENIGTSLDLVDALRVSFDNILIDCRSVKESADVAILSSCVDGIVVVVDAGRSRRDEILNAQRTIETAGGNFLGFVLNQRRYPVPEWLYKRL